MRSTYLQDVSTQSERRLRVIRLLLLWQLAMASVAGVLVGVGFGWWPGRSALIGGLIAWLPNCWFAWRAFRYRGARAARRIVRSFYVGQAGKMLMTAGLFALAFIHLDPLWPLALFAGFAAVQAVSWIVPIVVSRSERQAKG